jgi:hypothetical protein
MPPADVIKDRRVTALVQGLAPALSDGSRLSWAAPSSLHEGLGFRAMAPDRIQGDAAKPRFDEAQSGIMFAQTRRRLLRHKRASLAPRGPPSSPLRAASGGDLRSGLTAPARGAADGPRSRRRNAPPSNKETGTPSIRLLLTDGLHTRTRWMGVTAPIFAELRLLKEDEARLARLAQRTRKSPASAFTPDRVRSDRPG